uniref:Signal recognition particle receptor subunit alpha n=1 Tax=Cacopsylla melanoneura TaxID=428564 RepID=A0A8D8Y3Q0_9HEMI
MLDFFTIFSKGGIVLWYFQSASQIFTPSLNALIKSVILQERAGSSSFEHNGLVLKHRLDNEFDLVFVVGFQKILQLSYVDKLLDDVQLEFRDRYKNELVTDMHLHDYKFQSAYKALLKAAEEWSKEQANIPKQMKTFQESLKSKKTIASMIIDKNKKEEKNVQGKKKGKQAAEAKVEPVTPPSPVQNGVETGEEDIIMLNRQKLAMKMGSPKNKTKTKTPKANAKEGKKPRIWELSGDQRDLSTLEYTKDKPSDANALNITPDTHLIGKMVGGIKDLEVESDSEEDESSDDEDLRQNKTQVNSKKTNGKASKGMFSMFRGLVGNKSLTQSDMQPILDKLKDHLITKNVAADIAVKLCESVALKLEGKVLGTFDSVTTTVKTTLTDALVQILSPKRRVDILRDALEAKKQGRPFVMAFCGVNGVGKSTNLAKICFWLIENNLNVLIAACDTFRAGAVEQLRTHVRHLCSLHPAAKHQGREMVQLFEKGYGKDPADIAFRAISHAREMHIDVVLIDTAGRMQDNEPLMRALAKLVKVNQPDLLLFVGEALVGNEAVDQLVKFNNAMADHSLSENPHLIDGIVLTKFDTIDDKVGAAISMTYITGQPIVFVGTGQTYTDLKSLNAKAVVNALMK